MGFCDRLEPADVHNPKTFAQYVQQTCGVPYVAGKDILVLAKRIKDFFNQNPDLDYDTLCRLADWARAKKKRPGNVQNLMAHIAAAWKDGYLPELDRSTEDKDLAEQIYEAAEREPDREWRFKLLGAEGNVARQNVLDMWRTHRVPA